MGVSPSASVAEAVQLRSEVVVTPVVGLRDRVLIVGLVFTTLIDAELLSVPLSVSAAVTAHVMLSPGEAVLVVRVTVSLEPRDVFCVSFVQA